MLTSMKVFFRCVWRRFPFPHSIAPCWAGSWSRGNRGSPKKRADFRFQSAYRGAEKWFHTTKMSPPMVGRSPVRAFVYAIASLIVLEAIALALHLVIVRHINIPSGQQTIQSDSLGEVFVRAFWMIYLWTLQVLPRCCWMDRSEFLNSFLFDPKVIASKK